MQTIIPRLVKQIREARQKSQAELLKNTTKIASRTLQRIESTQTESYGIREGTFYELAKLLRVDPKVLTGELPLPDDIANHGTSTPKQELIEQRQNVERYETRLVKLGDKFVIVEFNNSNPTGRIIAGDITDEAAGLRLSSSSEMRLKLDEVYYVLSHPDGVEAGWQEMSMTDEAWYGSPYVDMTQAYYGWVEEIPAAAKASVNLGASSSNDQTRSSSEFEMLEPISEESDK